jgi:hypothetical protein
METKSESKIQNRFERKHTVYWINTVNATYMETQIELLLKQVTLTPRLLFLNYNQVVLWSYIVVHCCRYNTFPCLIFVH